MTGIVKTKKAGTARKPKPVIGWREWAALPGLNVEAVKAKIDTGARTSALHAFRIKEIDVDGVPHVSFFVHPVQHKKKPEIACTAKIVDKRVITSSNGQRQSRYVIVTPVRIGSLEWPIELTLTNRDEMGFRMLLGREAVRKRFLVDPGSSFTLSRDRA